MALFSTVIQSIQTHPVSYLLGSMYFLSAAVGSLPAPGSTEKSSTLVYRWFFDTVHTLLNQVDKVVASRYPQYKGAGVSVNVPASTQPIQPVPTEKL